MDAYPSPYVLHNLPFVVLSGLGAAPELEPQQSFQALLPGHASTTINAEIPPVASDRAEKLLQEFLSYDGTNASWEARRLDSRENTARFRMRAVGRVGQAPHCTVTLALRARY